MKNDSMYLISRRSYVKHIDDCVMLFGMLQEVCDQISQLPQNRGCKALTDMAADYYDKAIAIMGHSGIPTLYPLFGDERFLRPLFDKELTAAEPAEEDDDNEDEVFEDDENYDDEDEELSTEEIIVLTLSDLTDAVLEMNGYLNTITHHLKK